MLGLVVADQLILTEVNQKVWDGPGCTGPMLEQTAASTFGQRSLQKTQTQTQTRVFFALRCCLNVLTETEKSHTFSLHGDSVWNDAVTGTWKKAEGSGEVGQVSS